MHHDEGNFWETLASHLEMVKVNIDKGNIPIDIFHLQAVNFQYDYTKCEMYQMYTPLKQMCFFCLLLFYTL